MSSKRNFPLPVVEALSNWYKANARDVKRIIKDDSITFKDIEENSHFKFDIFNVKAEKGIITMSIKTAPFTEIDLQSKVIYVNFDQLTGFLDGWLAIVKKFRKRYALFDGDDYINKYAEYYNELITLTDVDAEVEPFDIYQQDIIVDYFENFDKIVEEWSDKIDPKALEFIEEEKKNLIKILPNVSKNEFLRGWSIFMAYLRKISIPFSKVVLETFLKLVVAKLATEGLLLLKEKSSLLLNMTGN